MRPYRAGSLAAVLSAVAWFAPGCHAGASSRAASGPPEFQDWRRQRENALHSESGYLALAGLYWLGEGIHRLGSAPDNDLVLPAGRAPQHAGSVRVKGGQVTATSAPGVRMTVDGRAVTAIAMTSDAGERQPTRVQLGELTFWIIERSGRIGLRLSDPKNPLRTQYTHTPCFPYNPAWRLPARFEPLATPQTFAVPTILGIPTPVESPGTLVFRIENRDYRLQPIGTTASDYFVVFGDRSNGRETYGGGRFVMVPIPDTGQETIIDFNKAYNPPCAYSAHTTCPMPPPQNQLPLRIDAGERVVRSGSHGA